MWGRGRIKNYAQDLACEFGHLFQGGKKKKKVMVLVKEVMSSFWMIESEVIGNVRSSA